jgi:hypothetical protein
MTPRTGGRWRNRPKGRPCWKSSGPASDAHVRTTSGPSAAGSSPTSR